jgi:CBS domain containing-hemolysin-like protein
MIVLLGFLFAAQFLIAAGFASFGIAARLHEEAVFPRRMRGSFCARILHRGRLHFILSLLGIEAIVLAGIAVVLHRMLGEGQPWQFALLEVLGIAAAVTGVTIAAFGVASMDPPRCARIVSYPLLPVYYAFRPLAALFLRVVSIAFPNLPREMATPFFLFPGVRSGGAKGFIRDKASRLIRSIQEFEVKKVREVMVPRIDIFAIDVHTRLDEIRERVSSAGHSRVPVYDGSIDRIVGMLHVKDLLKVPLGEAVRLDRGRLVREAYFVPEGKKIDDLLGEFQKGKKHMAIVVDEYGGTSGIVTLEDILEEIVGEIFDEYDSEPPLMRQTAPREYVAAGWVTIDHVNSSIGVSLPSDEVDTLGGFLYNLVGRVPEEGEEIMFNEMRFRINRLDGQRIVEVTMWLPEG